MIDKSLYDKRRYKKLNGNVIKLPITDEWWKIKDDEDKENGNGNDESRKKIIIRLASFDPEIDLPIMAAEYWQQQWENHPYKNRFKNAHDFMKWSLANEDQPTFNKGGSVNSEKSGLASLAHRAVADGLLESVRSGKVALQFAPPQIQRKLNRR